MFMRFLTAGLLLLTSVTALEACPFCAAVTPTFAEQMETMDVVLIGRLVHAADPAQIDPATGDMMASKFEVTRVFQGKSTIEIGDTVDVIMFEPGEVGQLYFLVGEGTPQLTWNLPQIVSARVPRYIDDVLQLPANPERLTFFLDYLEDEDEAIQRDAYSEFAKTPYDGVKQLRDHLDREQLLRWIDSDEVSSAHRRLYFTLLGVCGNPADADRLEERMVSDDETDRDGLDALIGCYLTLKGEAGLPFIREHFFESPGAYAETVEAIAALRFHGNESDAIPRESLLSCFRIALQQPKLANFVIPDLARWEDWSVVGQLQQLFLDAAENAHYLRVPIVNYLTACPTPEAASALASLEKQHPDAVAKARAYGMFADFTAPDLTASPADGRMSFAETATRAESGLLRSTSGGSNADNLDTPNPYPGLWWGVPMATMILVVALSLLRP